MDVPTFVWWLTIIGIVGLLVFDFVFHVRRGPRPPRPTWPAAPPNDPSDIRPPVC